MGIISKIMGSTGCEPTKAMKHAMELGSMFVGLDVTFLHDTCSSRVPYTEILAGSTLTIIGMIQSSSDQYMWNVELGIPEQDDPEDLPVILTVAELFEATDLGFVLSASGGIELAKVHFSRYI